MKHRVPASVWIVAVFACGLLSADNGPAQLFERASRALKAGDYAAAESGFRQVLRLDPHSVAALGNLGVVYSKTHRFGPAIEAYKQALRLTPQDHGLLLNVGLAYLKQEDYLHALQYFQQLHAKDAMDNQATNLLATCLVFGGQPKAALDLLKPIVEDRPDPAAIYLLGLAYARTGEVEAGRQVFEKLLNAGATKAQSSFLLGHAYYDSTLFEEAKKYFQEVLRADSSFPGAHRELGKVYISVRRNDEAEQQLRLALQADPRDSGATYFLGALLVQIGRYAEGVPYLEQVRRTDPDSWAAYLYLGKAKLRLNQPKAALQLLQKAAEMNPEEPSIFYLQAYALRAEGRKEEARIVLQHVTQLHSTALDAEKRALQNGEIVGAR